MQIKKIRSYGSEVISIKTMCKISEAFFFILLSWFVAWHKYYISYINYCRALYTLLQSERNLPKRGVVPKGGEQLRN